MVMIAKKFIIISSLPFFAVVRLGRKPRMQHLIPIVFPRIDKILFSKSSFKLFPY